MSFNVVSKDGPTIPKPATATASIQTNARERAIAALMGQQGGQTNQSQTNPVANPTQVSPEEVSAVKASENTTEVAEEVAAEGQNDTVEDPAKPTEETKATEVAEPEEPLSQQFALLARKEKALRAKAQAQDVAIKAREADIAAREQAMKSRDTEYQTKFISIDKLQDPVAALAILEQHGLTYDKLTEAAALRPQRDPYAQQQIAALEAKLAALEGKADLASKNVETQQQQQYQQAIKQIKTEAHNLVNTSQDFEMVKESGAVSDVVDLIERTFKEDGVLLSVEEAAKAVEDFLIEKAIKIAKLNKIQQRLKPQAPSQSPAPAKQQAAAPTQKQGSPMKTLTNAVGASRQLSAKERAILAFKGELKS